MAWEDEDGDGGPTEPLESASSKWTLPTLILEWSPEGKKNWKKLPDDPAIWFGGVEGELLWKEPPISNGISSLLNARPD